MSVLHDLVCFNISLKALEFHGSCRYLLYLWLSSSEKNSWSTKILSPNYTHAAAFSPLHQIRWQHDRFETFVALPRWESFFWNPSDIGWAEIRDCQVYIESGNCGLREFKLSALPITGAEGKLLVLNNREPPTHRTKQSICELLSFDEMSGWKGSCAGDFLSRFAINMGSRWYILMLIISMKQGLHRNFTKICWFLVLTFF